MSDDFGRRAENNPAAKRRPRILSRLRDGDFRDEPQFRRDSIHWLGQDASHASMPDTAYNRARTLIDSAHASDPSRTAEGRPAELAYADAMESWVLKLDPGASPLLRLAARCQHLERWSVPRATFPMDKPGYHAWRRLLYTRQSERARELVLSAGVSEIDASALAGWVSKQSLKTDAGSQMLEDAACLVFLEREIAGFAAQHADYPREKFVEILRKTWRKMSPAGHAAALALDLPADIASLLREAVGQLRG